MNSVVLPRLRLTSSGLASAWILLAMSAGPLLAADKTWDGEGANDNWQTAGNWDPFGGGTAPVAGDSLFFDGATRLTPNNDFTVGTSFLNITFNPSASSFTLGGNAVTLPTPPLVSYAAGQTAAFFGGSITNFSSSPQTIALPLTLDGGHHHIIGNAGGSTLTLSGPLTLGAGASVGFSDGVNVTGSGLANVNGILGGWAITATPTTWAALDGGNNVVGFTAFTDINAGGTIASDATSNVRIVDSGPNVTLAAAGTTDINTLHFGTAPVANQTVDIAAGRILRFGSKGGIFNASRQITSTTRVLTIGTASGTGSVTAGGAPNTPGEIHLIDTPLIFNSGNNIVMNSRITNNGTGAVTVHMYGHISYPAITGGHTYSGGTHIHGGRLQTTPNIVGTGPIYIYPGGQLFWNAAGTCTNDIFMAGYGNGESVGNGAIRAGGRACSGVITLTADAATANGTFSGRITGPGGLHVGAGSGNGVGTMTISATNDYAGNTLINGTNATAASSLAIATGRSHIMPHGAGKGNLILRGISLANPATFNLNGTDQTINGLLSFGNGTGDIVTNSAATAANLILGDGNANGDYSGVISSTFGPLGLAKIGTGTQTLRGINNYTNGTTANGGTLVFATVGSYPTAGAQSLTINSNATVDLTGAGQITLGVGSSLTMSNGTLITGIPSAGSAFTVSTFNSLGATNIISVASIPSIFSYPAQFVALKFTNLNGSLNFGLGSLPVSPGTPFAGYISNNVANNSVDLVVTSGPASIRWQGFGGGSPNSAWDTTTVNWITFAGSPTLYSDGNFVRFDDSASNSVVALSQDVSPAGITVSNSSLSFTLNGGFKVGGAGSLTKQGSGTFTVNNTSANDFSGGINISGGSLRFGNNDANGTIPATGNIVDNGDLAIFRADNITVANPISGTGTVTKNASGTLTLSGANTFTGAVNVVAGTLQIGNASALGTTVGGTTVSSGATVDFNALNIGLEPVTVSGSGVGGAGALVNNGAQVFPAVAFVTLAGDTVFGGSGRWDLRSAATGNPSQSSLSTVGNQPFKLTKIGGNQVSIVGTTVTPSLGDIEIQAGILGVETATTGLGNVNSNLIVWPGATFQIFAATNQLNKRFTLGGDNVNFTISATSGGGNTIIGPMSITNDCAFNVNNNTVALNLNNVITGPGKITKVGAGTLTFSGNSPDYAGGLVQNAGNITLSGTLSNALGVTVSAGKFLLNGSLLGSGVSVNGIATMAGSGSSAGAVDCSGLMLPGDTNVVGTLTTGSLILESGATLSYELTSTNTFGGTNNDLIVVNGDLTINGNTININPVGLLLTGPGNKYRLFNYTGTLTVNSPLNVVGPNNYVFTVDTSTANQVNIEVSGGPPVWNGGSPTTSVWTDPLNWGGVTISPGSPLFFAGNTRLNNTNDTASGTTYGQMAFVTGSGDFVLNGNDITLGGNVDNFSTATQTLVLNLSYNANRSLNGGSGLLKIGGGLTNTANNSILTLAGKGILTNRLATADPNSISNTLAMVDTNTTWTVIDNSTATPVTIPMMFDLQAGTFKFGEVGSAPEILSTSLVNSRLGVVPGSPAILNVVGGKLTISARLNTGSAANSLATINQSGGTLKVMDLLQISDSSANAWTAVNVTGGLLDVANDAGPRNMFIASRGTGIVTVANSGVISCATLDMSRNAAGNTLGSIGVVNLNGGILSVSRVGAATGAAQAGGTPTATFNFNGGVLKANASSATWYQGNASAPTLPIVSIVKSGGAIIDTTNFTVSVLEALQHDSTLGATPDGGLRKLGTGELTLTAANGYTGPTTISNGTLTVSGSIGIGTVSVESGGTLRGGGSIGSNVTVKAGATISAGPGAATGILTVAGNVTMQADATNFMELNKATVSSDQIRAIAGTPTTITYAGTLSLQNLAGTLAAGDSFKLFAASNYLGSFSTITPASPGPNLVWVTSALNTSGTISIAAAPIPRITSISLLGGSVVLSGTNGPVSTGYSVLTSTNVALPISSWSLAGTASFDGSGNFSFTNGAPTEPTRFYLLQVP